MRRSVVSLLVGLVGLMGLSCESVTASCPLYPSISQYPGICGGHYGADGGGNGINVVLDNPTDRSACIYLCQQGTNYQGIALDVEIGAHGSHNIGLDLGTVFGVASLDSNGELSQLYLYNSKSGEYYSQATVSVGGTVSPAFTLYTNESKGVSRRRLLAIQDAADEAAADENSLDLEAESSATQSPAKRKLLWASLAVAHMSPP